jgi:outer membrane receptor for ferrienterochelin and colicins
MKTLFSLLLLLCLVPAARSQALLRMQVRDGEGSALPAATVLWKERAITVQADSIGALRFEGVPTGRNTFTFSHVGFLPKTLELLVSGDSTLTITLEGAEEEEEEVVVRATRTSLSIANTPTRIEVISGEELEEKGNMKPGDIRMLLNETTGIQTQQTSATSYNAGIRIQGLEGRYTQLLRDGYPLYAGFSGGLSILQIAPLDLRQVEVIKGASSTLYGGGAIAGLVNLVSKTPGEKRELLFLANVTSAGGLDLSAFYSERYGRTGLTLYGARNSTAPFDPAGIGFTAIPRAERYTANPRLFIYGERTNADIGLLYTTENRIGGSTEYLRRGGSGFFEQNKTERVVAQFGVGHRLAGGSLLQWKSSFSFFDRSLRIPGDRFVAAQYSGFAELTWNKRGEKLQWIAGASLLTDDLRERERTAGSLRDYTYRTYGLFVQQVWTPGGAVSVESGLRADHASPFGWELLPRVSVMIRATPHFTTRIGGGLGYKTPTIFTEEAERLQFRNILPPDPLSLRNERSAGLNWDLDYRGRIGTLEVGINHLFFYTRLRRPVALQPVSGGLALVNSPGATITRGTETNLRLRLGAVKLFVGYTFTDARTGPSGARVRLPLTARHRLNNVLMYEVEEKWKLGLEAYYFSPQLLNDGTTGRAYWITGFMAERIWERFSLFINFENFGNTRQTRFGPIYTGTQEAPQFRDIYAPLEGFVANGGIKLRL